MSQRKLKLDKEITKKVTLDYLLYLPKGYEEEQNEKWPMILFLHGMGERGDDVEKIKKHGIPKIIEQGTELPFIAVSPQCPEDSVWNLQSDALIALLDDIIEKYSVDEERIYLTGLSMGGYGTWNLAMQNPEKFAAVAPICGGGFPAFAYKMKDVPTWVFHGAKDDVVPISESEILVNILKELGADIKFTVYPEATHDSWTETYNNPELYRWFLQHKTRK